MQNTCKDWAKDLLDCIQTIPHILAVVFLSIHMPLIVAYGLANKIEGVEALGIDEVQYKNGHTSAVFTCKSTKGQGRQYAGRRSSRKDRKNQP